MKRLLVGAGTVVLGVATSVSASAAAPFYPLRDQRVASGLGTAPSAVGAWTSVAGRDGRRLQTLVRGAGLAQVSASTGEVDELIFSRRLASPPRGSLTGLARAGAVARAFAGAHFRGFAGLGLREARLLNHRSLVEYQFSWQQRRGLAWLPVRVTVGVNGITGEVAYYWSERGPVDVSTMPRISSAQAGSSAARLFGGARGVQVGRPELDVVDEHGVGRLVWITSVARTGRRQPFVPGRSVVSTDAQTGVSQVVAVGGGGVLSRSAPTPGGASTPLGAQPTRPSSRSGPGASATSSTPVYGSCYDAFYFDGLSSRYAANHCASALSAAGYTPRAYDNASALTAAINSASDAVFFMGGHSMDLYDNGCVPSCGGPHTAAALLYESPDSSGNLDGLAGDAFISAYDIDSTGPTTICSEGGGCHSQSGFIAYPWGDGNPQTFKLNLAVLEACATAQETASYTLSMADYVHDYWAGTVIGFVDDISFPANVDESNTYGDAWANTFWSDLGSGAPYATAVVDAANAVGNQYGFNSWVLLRSSNAPTSLYPAQYYPLRQ